MMNHEYGIKPFDAAQVTAATVRARAEMNKIVNGLRKLGGPWEGMQIAATAEQIGVRDGRRIAGRYTVNKDDLITGARHDDAVVAPDLRRRHPRPHRRAQQDGRLLTTTGIKVKPYDIPLRALIAKDVDGLMMAGRCISGDFIAHASYRVTGNAVAMGEAAGVIAALAAKQAACRTRCLGAKGWPNSGKWDSESEPDYWQALTVPSGAPPPMTPIPTRSTQLLKVWAWLYLFANLFVLWELPIRLMTGLSARRGLASSSFGSRPAFSWPG